MSTDIKNASNKWTNLKIKDIAEVFGGSTPSTAIPSNWNGNIPWFTPGEISESGNGLVSNSKRENY